MFGGRYSKIKTVIRLRLLLYISAFFALFSPTDMEEAPQGKTLYIVSVNEENIGVAQEPELVRSLYRTARRELAAEGITCLDMPELVISSVEVMQGEISTPELLLENMKNVLRGTAVPTRQEACEIKVGETLVTLSDMDEAQKLLQEVIDVYDLRNQFRIDLVRDTDRALYVMEPVAEKRDGAAWTEGNLPTAGAAALLERAGDGDIDVPVVGFDSFDYGIDQIAFNEKVEIVETCMPEGGIMSYDEAKSLLTEMQEEQIIYKVQPGDTLSGIALSAGLPLDTIIEMNDSLADENSVIRVDQELVLTTPEPQLSVVWSETAHYREIYDLPVEYIYNDQWYSNQSETRTQPSAGSRDAVIRITRCNDEEVNKEILYEVVEMEAVAKVVEIGTIVPPSYIKPLSGGRISSGFGYRGQPTAGASTYHKGVDIATPIGTSIWASSGGVVSQAGWQGGYGNVVFIDHPDGRQTRYGHLSRIYVSVGDTVRQGQVIAASGNTGVSTGPHLHFEMRIGGEPVDPRNYVNLN